MNYAEWSKIVPRALTDDPLWTLEAYRLAFFAADLGWRDVTKLMPEIMIPDQRGNYLHEEGPPYATGTSGEPRSVPAGTPLQRPPLVITHHGSRITHHAWSNFLPT